MSYQLWIPFKQNKIEPEDDEFRRQLYQNWAEIENWGNNLDLAGGTALPFLVVAADGTGDYDDPCQAITSLADATPTVIYVKPGTYTTTSCNISGKHFTMWGQPIGDVLSTATVIWNFSAGGFTTSSTTRAHFVGMAVTPVNASFGLVSGAILVLDHTIIGGGGNTGASNGGTTYARNSYFPIHSTSFSGTVFAWDSWIVMPNATMTLTSAAIIWQDCTLLPGGASTHVTLAQGAATGNYCTITGCSFGEFNELILSGWDECNFTGNSNRSSVSGGVLGTRLSKLTCTGNDHLIVDSMMWGTALIINGSQRFNCGGIWGNEATTSTINGNGGTINATFDCEDTQGGEPATAVEVSGDHIAGSIFVNGSDTNGVLLSGDNNVLQITGTNNATDLVNVTGANNKIAVEVGGAINPVAPAGANVYL